MEIISYSSNKIDVFGNFIDLKDAGNGYREWIGSTDTINQAQEFISDYLSSHPGTCGFFSLMVNDRIVVQYRKSLVNDVHKLVETVF